MAEEEKQETTDQAPEAEAAEETPAAEETEAPEAPAEEPAAEEVEEASEEEAPEEEEAPAEKAPAAEAAAEEPAEPQAPKARRKLERSRHTGDARPPRSAAERAEERRAQRAAKAQARRRARAAARQRRGEPGHGTPPAEAKPGTKKVRQGVVVSAKSDKTITVRIAITRRHPTYEKVVRNTNTIHAHDEENQAQEGDTVRVVESRPMSRTKRWRLVEVLERAR